jgi:regulator of sirC expression with transglutaminase-like and TPR domain
MGVRHVSSHPFDRLVQRDDARIRLAEASLLFAGDHCPGLAPGPWLRRLDALARRAGQSGARTAPDQVAALRGVLVEEAGFAGNTEDYHDPRNSFLNEVLARKVGIPISLSVVWLDVAARLGWPFSPIGLPGHFLVRRDTADGGLLVDPFGGGAVVRPEDCEAVAARALGEPVSLGADHFRPLSTKAVLARQLNNLRVHYVRRERWRDAACVLARLLALQPESSEFKREHAAVGVEMGRLN